MELTGTIVPLRQLYLNAFAVLAEAEKLTAVLQEINENEGRIWLVPGHTTTPEAFIVYKFGVDGVALAMQTRSQQELAREVKYAEGLDAFLPLMQRALRAGRLAAPKASGTAAKRAAFNERRAEAQALAIEAGQQ
jgi:hypothetical protein